MNEPRKTWLATIDLKPGESLSLAFPTDNVEEAAAALQEASFLQDEAARLAAEAPEPPPKPPVVRDWLLTDGWTPDD